LEYEKREERGDFNELIDDFEKMDITIPVKKVKL
jgi:hypothetical protein